MSDAVRIEPEVSEVQLRGIVVRMATLALGGVPRGGAALVTGPGGLNPIEVVDTQNLLAQHGYESVAVQPDVDSLDDDAARDVVAHVLERLRDRAWALDQIGLIGYGLGARAVLVAASELELGAAVSIPAELAHLTTPTQIVGVRTAWLGMVGIGRNTTARTELSRFEADLAARSTQYVRAVGYAGVPDALHDLVEGAAHGAAYDCWQRTIEWLNTRVEPRPTPRAQAWRERLAASASATP